MRIICDIFQRLTANAAHPFHEYITLVALNRVGVLHACSCISRPPNCFGLSCGFRLVGVGVIRSQTESRSEMDLAFKAQVFLWFAVRTQLPGTFWPVLCCSHSYAATADFQAVVCAVRCRDAANMNVLAGMSVARCKDADIAKWTRPSNERKQACRGHGSAEYAYACLCFAAYMQCATLAVVWTRSAEPGLL